ncbi:MULTISPECIES: hypothetical protein [Actinomycetes]|uniref:hypothetical protein n=1 Tax=Streptomyces sp. L7 TaxID=3423954 RepID=UPI0011C03788
MFTNQAKNAACSLVAPIAEQVTSDIDTALKSAVVNPAAAAEQLTMARGVLAPVADQLPSGQQKTGVQAVVDTIDQLLPVLKKEAAGAPSEPSSDALRQKLSQQVRTLTAPC